jgi:hypothetical protein
MGDIEELRDVISETFGAAYVAETMLPRYDLAYWLGRIGYVETTRYCNFRCSFCSLTAEGTKLQNLRTRLHPSANPRVREKKPDVFSRQQFLRKRSGALSRSASG